MIFFSFSLLSLIFLIMQTTLFPLLPKWMGNPDLVFITTIFAAIHFETPTGLVLTFTNGLLMDVFAGMHIGIYPVVFLSLFFLIKAATNRFILNDAFHQPPFIILCYLLSSGAVFFLSRILASDQNINWIWRDVLLQTLIIALLAIPLHLFFKSILTVLQKKKIRSSLKRTRSGNYFHP